MCEKEIDSGTFGPMYEEIAQPLKPVVLGLFKGKIKVSDDFNEPLPDSFWLEGKL